MDDRTNQPIAEARREPERHIVAIAKWANLNSTLRIKRQQLSAIQGEVERLESEAGKAFGDVEKLLPPACERFFKTDYGLVRWDGRSNVKLSLVECENAQEH
jgi:hypothetical protein